MRKSEALEQLARLARAVGTQIADVSVPTPGLAIHDWRESGTFEVVEITPGGAMQYPLGRGVRTNTAHLRKVNEYIAAFSLTTNLFGETERIVVDSEEQRTSLLTALNVAGSFIGVMGRLIGPENKEIASEAATAIARAKSLVLTKTEVTK